MATFETLTPIAEVFYQINLSGETQTLELEGPPGTGKTAWAHEFARHMAAKLGVPFGCCVRHLSTEDPLDGPGALFIDDNEGGEGKLASRTYPSLFPQTWEFADGVIPEHGVLVMDEYGQADNDQKKSTATLIDERRLGRFRLPVGWMVICTSNRVKDRAGVAKPLTFVTNRKTPIAFEYSSELHSDYMLSKNIHHKLASFARANPSVVQCEEVPDHDNPYCTARSFYRAARQLMAFGVVDSIGTDQQMSPVARLARESVVGTIGEGTAMRLFGHLRHCEHMVTIEEIMENPSRAKLPDRPDVTWATVQMIAGYCKERADDDTLSLMPLLSYMQRLPENFQMACIRMIAKASKKLLMDARYAEWVRNNRELIMAAVAASNK